MSLAAEASCFVDGTTGSTCDGAGTCVNADVTACKGYCGPTQGVCEDSCDSEDFVLLPINEVFPLKNYYVNAATLFDNLYMLAGGFCVADEWEFTVIQPVFFTANEGGPAWRTVQGALHDCGYLLNDTLVDVKNCIAYREFQLDDDFMHTYLMNFWSAVDDIEPTFRLKACVFKYACSVSNSSVLNDPANWGNPYGLKRLLQQRSQP